MTVLPYITAAFAAGIAIAAKINIPMPLLLLLILAALAAACVMTIKKKPAVAVLLFLFLFMGAFVCRLAAQNVQAPVMPLLDVEGEYSGYINEVLPSVDGNSRFVFYVEEMHVNKRESMPVNTAVRVFIYAPPSDFEPAYGMRLRLQGTISQPSGQRNPGGFNYAAYLETNSIGAVMNAKADTLICLEGRKGNPVIALSEQLRLRAIAVFKKHLPEAEAGLASGMILGQRAAVMEETVEAYEQLGLAHLLAVSGLHVGFVAAFALFMAVRLFGSRPFVKFVFTAVLVIGYALVTGGRPPVWRAALTLLIALSAAQFGRESEGLQALALSALMMLFVRPLWLFSLSFQFSFAATAGILLISPRLKPSLARLPQAVAGTLGVTIAAQLSVLPLQVTYFGLLSVLTLPLNLICIPLVGIVMMLGLGAVLFGLIHPAAAAPLCVTAQPLLTVLDNLPRLLAVFPAATLHIPLLPALWWAVYLALLVLFIKGYKVRPITGKKVMAALIIVNLLLFSGLPARNRLMITFLDVGQGLSVHLQTPAGHHILIDAGGGSPTVGEDIIYPYLRANRVKGLDLLMLTHPHDDHYGGMPAILERIPVKTFVSNGRTEEAVSYTQLQSALEDKNIPHYVVSSGYQLTLDQVKLFVLSPPKEGFCNTVDDINNNSLVMQIHYHDFSCLIMGDAERAAVERLLINESESLQTDILQVPHHGSRNALPAIFLAQASPKAAVISVGKNIFGHPHAETLSLLNEQGSVVYRTDLHGAVTITSDGYAFNHQSFLLPAAAR